MTKSQQAVQDLIHTLRAIGEPPENIADSLAFAGAAAMASINVPTINKLILCDTYRQVALGITKVPYPVVDFGNDLDTSPEGD